MSQLREPLEDLVAEVPSYVVPDPRAAWSAGARRRTRRRLGAAGLVLVLVGLAGAGLGVLPRLGPVGPVDQPGGTHPGHPTRIDHAWWTRDLPVLGDPVAGLLQRQRTDAAGVWDAVSADGHLWRVPDVAPGYLPAVSPNGLEVAYLDGGSGPEGGAGQDLVIRHVIDGGLTELTGIGHPDHPPADQPYALPRHTPMFWSPASSRLLVPVERLPGRTAPDVPALVVEGADGGARPVRYRAPGASGRSFPVGWLSDDTLGWVSWRDANGGDLERATLIVTSQRGVVLDRVRLELPEADSVTRQLSGGLASPDGDAVALTMVGDGGAEDVLVYSTSGSLVAASPVPAGAVPTCPLSWAPDEPLVPVAGRSEDAVLTSAAGPVRIQADPRLRAGCSLWAADALAGDAHGGLGGAVFGDSASWLSWHWRESGLAALGVVGLVLVVGLRRRRREDRG